MKLKTHIDFIESIESNTYTEFVKGLSAIDKLDFINNQDKVYPLPKSPDPIRVRNMSDKYNLYINILQMNLGQFIMLESQIRSSRKRDDIIASLVIRPKDELNFDNENQIREEEIIKTLLDEDVLDVHSVVLSMMLNRDYILFTKFSGVIYNRIDDKEDEQEEEEDKTNQIGDDEFNSQWFWYKIVRQLANEDLTMFDKIYELKMSVVMVELSFLAQKSILENARARSEEARQRALYRR
jgi:hypothetical protein